jgi:hypothetical protein
MAQSSAPQGHIQITRLVRYRHDYREISISADVVGAFVFPSSGRVEGRKTKLGAGGNLYRRQILR